MTGVFPGLPWVPPFETEFPLYRPGAEGMEHELLVDPGAEDISRARIYSFKLGVFASADKINWTDITATTNQIGPIWYGTLADNVYGWSFQVSGTEYNPALLSPGCYIRLSKETTTLAETAYVESWMSGTIMPSPVEYSYQMASWSVQVVDDITYLARKKSPVFSVGTQNIALNATVSADSSIDASLAANEGEFYGAPPLTEEQAIDGDLNSLWISSKSPDPSETKSYFPYEDVITDKTVILNEFYYKGYSPTSNQDQWFEMVTASSNTDPRTFRMLTRSGAIEIADVTFGRPTNLPGVLDPALNAKVAHYAIVTYDAGRHTQIWGEQTDVPVSEYKNSRGDFVGVVEPDAFGFNADGQGDFFAMSHAGTLTNGEWKVFAVVDGPKMRRFDKGFFTTPVNVTGGAFTISLTDEWTANELEGCFIRNNQTDVGLWEWNACRRIIGNTVSVPSTAHPGYFDTRITVYSGWANTATGGESDIPEVGDPLIIRPWPEYKQSHEATGWKGGGHGWYWRDDNSTNYADYHMLAAVEAGTTWRKSRDGWWRSYNGDDPGGTQIWDWASWETWIKDRTPSPGPSSGYAADPNGENDQAVDKFYPWIQVSPPRFSVITTAKILDGDTTIHVQSTDGLFQSYPDLVIPDAIREILVAGTMSEVAYLEKTATTIVLQSAWDQGEIGVGTPIYQFEDAAATDVWPISFITLKRRRVPGFPLTPPELRLLRGVHVFLSYQDNPLSPTDEQWRESWDSGSNPTNPDGVPIFTLQNNRTLDIITFQVLNGGTFNFTRNYTRAKHILVSIRRMTDLSRGRLNEIEIIPPQDTVQGLTNSTVAEFFSYILLQLGIPLANIQVGNASTALLGTFSTDTSAYLDLLSDLATRTGQVVWSGPNLQARVYNHPNWPSSPVMDRWLTIDNSSASNLAVMPYTGYPISQLQVTVRDAEGNTETGVYPPTPLEVGEIVVESVVRTADIAQANGIARMLYNETSLAKLKATITGPAPWARPGAYRVDLNYTLPSGTIVTGPYYISGIDHKIDLGGVGAPRSWVTELELTRIIGAS